MIENAQLVSPRAPTRSIFALALPAALIGVAAGSLGYLAHHAPPLQGHTLEVIAMVALLAALLGAGLALALATRHAPALPEVVIAESSGAVDVRRATPADIEFASTLHARTLEHGFFVALGPRFLRSYHATFVESPHAVSLVATVGGHRVGALAGILRPPAHRSWTIRRHGIRLVAGGLLALASRPRPALRFVTTRLSRYARAWHARPPGKELEAAGSTDTPAVLSHVAVLPGARKSGVGGRLVSAFADAAVDAGADQATLVTLEDEDGAGAFYAGLGWTPGQARPTPDGRRLREWTIPLPQPRDP